MLDIDFVSKILKIVYFELKISYNSYPLSWTPSICMFRNMLHIFTLNIPFFVYLFGRKDSQGRMYNIWPRCSKSQRLSKHCKFVIDDYVFGILQDSTNTIIQWPHMHMLSLRLSTAQINDLLPIILYRNFTTHSRGEFTALK
jgi:hypothetical protein